jgi:hypothetical protein
MINNTSKQILLSVIGVAVLIIAVIGVSFAFFTYTRIGANSNNIVGAGNIDFKFADGNTLNLVNPYPISSEEGRTLIDDGHVVRFTVSGNVSDGAINYVVKLIPGEQDENRIKFNDSEVFAYISSPELEGITFNPRGSFGTTGQAIGNEEVILGTGTLTSKSHVDKEFEVRLWVDDSVVSVSENGTYTPEELSNMYYSMKVKVEVQNNS